LTKRIGRERTRAPIALLVALVVGAVFVALTPQRARAQSGKKNQKDTTSTQIGDVTPFSICSGSCPAPTVTITPFGGTFTTASQSITIDWCGQAALSSGSRSIVLNGVNVNGSFSYTTSSKAGCTNHATSTGTVTLAVGSNSLVASITDAQPKTGQASAFYTLTPSASHLVSTVAHNGSNLDVSKCVANCMDVTFGYSTPVYTSMDQPRALTLVYHGLQANPTGTITVDVKDTSTTRSDTTISLKILDASGTPVTNVLGRTENFFRNQTGAWLRLGARFGVPSLSTGAYSYKAVATSYYSNGTTASTTIPVRVLVINERNSPYGAGWSIAGLQRVYPQSDGGMVLTDGTGTVQYYAGPCASAPCSYASPLGEFSVLSKHSWGDGTVYDRRAPDGSIVAFTSDGYEAYAQDRFGNRTSYSYTSGRLATVTDPVGKVITVSLVGTSPYSGPKLTITDPAGRTTTLNLNTANDLVSIQDAAGGTPFQGTYLSSHLISSWTDRRGGAWSTVYDCAAHTANITAPTVVADGGSVQPVTGFVHQDVQTTACAGGGGANTSPATAVTRETARAIVTNPRGNSASFAVDAFGAPTRIEEPLGRVTIVDRDSASRVKQIVAPSGHTITNTWSGTNVTRTVDNTTGRAINYSYDSRYNLPLSVSGHTVTVTNHLNAAGTLIDSSRVGGTVATKFKYDSRGRDTLVTDPEGHTTRTHFESTWSNTDTLTVGVGHSTSYSYDNAGRVDLMLDAAYHTTRTGYDPLNRVQWVKGPGGDTTFYAFDSLYLHTVTDANHQVYRYERNALGWVDSLVDPGNRVDRFAYDRNGNVTSHGNRRGQTVSSTYDALDRQLSVSSPQGFTGFTYDATDRWMTAANAASVDTILFDVAGRRSQEIAWRAGRQLVAMSTYNDTMGVRDFGQWAPGHFVRYAYDAAYQLSSLLTGGAYTTLGHNADRNASTVTFSNGVTQNNSYTSDHSRSQIDFSPAGGVVDQAFQVATHEDSLGHVTTRYHYADTSRVYSYDDAGRLTGYYDQILGGRSCHKDVDQGIICGYFSQTNLGGETYSYDRVGNRTDGAGTIDAGNRIRYFHGDSLFYDADGNLVRKYHPGVLDESLNWDALGQLIQVIRSTDTTTFAYDGFGRRVRKTVGAVVTDYQWDDDQVVAERDSSGVLVAEYAFYPGLDQPHSVTTSAGTFVMARETPGNVIGLMPQSSNAVSAQYAYKPFGEMVRNDQTVTNSLRFQSRPYDAETGLYYFRARYYDPELGRFISEDPIGLDGGVNQYVFAKNDPINRSDPSGLETTCSEWTLTWKQVDQDRWIGSFECTGTVTLDPVVVSPDPGDSPSGASPNFGNPCARGGNCGTPAVDFCGYACGKGAAPVPQATYTDGTTKVMACTADHYGLGSAAVRGISWWGAQPVYKRAHDLRVLPGASEFTNNISYYAFTYLPKMKVGRQLLGSNRLAGVVGRANIGLSAALFAYDLTSITLCAAGS